MRSKGATTSTNYTFLASCFNEARNLPLEHPERILGCGLEGASRTGKDWDKCVFVCQYIAQFTGKKINFFRDTFANLKKTTYRTLKEVWGLFGYDLRVFNKTASEIHYNGNIISFLGVNDDPMRAMGLESDLALMGEAMSLIKDHCDQIEQRCNEFYIYDYNPTAPNGHWLFLKEHQPYYRLHKTTIFDNPYAPTNSRKKILSYAHPKEPAFDVVLGASHLKYTRESWAQQLQANIELNTADLYLWQVYGLGMRAVGEDVIFPRWQQYTDEEKPNESAADWVLLGGDFGYSNDPTVLVKCEKFGNNIYIRLLCYETGLLNADIARKMKHHNWNNDVSIWDSADGLKAVNELRIEGINATGARKGVGSVAFGIQYMKKFNLFLHHESAEMKKEFQSYKWAKKTSGEYKRNTLKQRVPSDNQADHAIDAARYAITYYAEGLKEDTNGIN